MDEETSSLSPVVAEHDVLCHGEGLDEAEVLVDHADARIERVARRMELDRLAVELDRALVGAVETGEDVREGCLPGAVLTEQRVHLPRRRLEVDPLVRDNAGEPLADPGHADRRDRGGAGRAGASLLQIASASSLPHEPTGA